jgi:uncharacterized membrane protein (UPF0182 family)
MTASSDPGNYGQLSAFEMPQGESVLGPVQIDNRIKSTPAVSQQLTLLNQQGSTVIQGSLQLIPVGNSIVYVRPFYAQSRQEGSFPQFQFVVVYSQGAGNAFCGQTVEDGLNQLLGLAPTTACSISTTPGGTGSDTTTTTTTTPGTATTTPATTAPTTTTVPATAGSAQELLNQAAKDLDDAQTALEAGNLGEYQRLVNDARTKVKQAQQKQGTG